MIRTLYRSQTGEIQTDLELNAFEQALQDKQGFLWVDLINESPEVCEPILLDIFGFHPLAVDDALTERHVPKLDDWDDYLYLVLRAVIYDPQSDNGVELPELDIFFGKNYLVTYHEERVTAIDQVWLSAQQDTPHLKRGLGYLLYRLLDDVVAGYIPVIETLNETLDQIEDQLFENPTPAALEQIFGLKRNVLYLRRITLPQREVLNKLAGNQYTVVDPDTRVFFRDVYDHLVRLHDFIESMRDLVVGAQNTYLSLVNNRMNNIVKTLTIITTIFMPLSFIVGFFGMNFFQPATPLDLWTGQTAFILTLVVLILLPLAMYLWIQRRGWM